MDVNIIGRSDFTKVNQDIQNVERNIRGLEKDLDRLNFDKVSDKMTAAFQLDPKAMGIKELQKSYDSLSTNLSTLNDINTTYSDTISNYQRLLRDLIITQNALTKEFARAAAAQDDKVMLQCRDALAKVGAETTAATAKLNEYRKKQNEVQEAIDNTKYRMEEMGEQIRANSIFEVKVKEMGVDDLALRIIDLKKVANEAEDEIKALNEQISAAQQANARLKSDINSKQAAVNSGTLNAAEVQAYNEEIAKLQAKIEENNRFIELWNAQIAAQTNQLNLANETIEECANRLDKLKGANPFDTQKLSVAELKKELEEANGKVGSLTSLQQQQQREVATNNRELEKYKGLLETSGDAQQKAFYTKKIEEYTRKLEESKKKLQETEKELERATTLQRNYADAMQKRTTNTNSGNGSLPDAGKMSALSKSMGDLSKSMGQITSGFKQMSQGGVNAAKGFTAMTVGVKGLGKALLGLLANPIVALIAAISAALIFAAKAIKNFFTNTTDGADKFAHLKGIFEGVKASIEQFTIAVGRKLVGIGELLGAFVKLVMGYVTFVPRQIINAVKTLFSTISKAWKALWEGFKTGNFDFSGIFSDAFKSMKDEFSESCNDMVEAWQGVKKEWQDMPDVDMPDFKENIKQYEQLQVQLRQLEKERFAWNKRSAELDTEKSALQETMYSGGQLQQLAAMDKMRGVINEKYSKEIEFAQRELDIQKQKNALAKGNASIDQLKAQQELEIKLLNLQSQRNNEIRSMARRYKSVTDALYAQQKSQQKELDKLEQDGQKNRRNADYDQMIKSLEFQKKYTLDINKQLEVQAELRQKNLQKQLEQMRVEKKAALEQIEEDKKANIRKTYGEQALKDYEQGKVVADSRGIIKNYDRKAELTAANYDQKMENAKRASEQAGTYEDMSTDIDAYTNYVEKIVELEEWKAEQLRAIREGESALSQEQVEQVYQTQKNQLQEQNGIDDVESIAADISANLTSALSTAVWENIQQIGEEALQQLDAQIKILESTKNNAITQLGTQGQTDEEGNTIEPTGIYAEIATAEADLAAGKEGAQERLNELRRKEKELTAQIQSADSQLIKLGKQRQNVEAQVNTALKQGTAQTKKLTKEQKWDVVSQSLGKANQALNALANTMGNALNKKSKKALDTMKTVVDFAVNNVNGIKELVQFTSKAMESTAAGAASAISTVEKASVILTIISLAIQAIQAIVDIATKYSKSAQMQEAIDDQLEKVDELKRRNEELQRSYQNKAGVDYYKGMANAAKDYNRIIVEQRKALLQAEELYQRQSSKHGSDSKKAKDAKEQVNDIKDGLNDLEDEQAELFNQLREELLTTDLQSFSESLADSLVDGFENGKEGISDTWNDMLNDLMTSMMKKQLALQLEKQFEGVFNEMNKRADDGELTQQEISEIMEMMDNASAGAQRIAEAYYDMMDEMGLLTDADNQGSKGGFESMSQDTADELNARFTALQIEGANVVASAQEMQALLTELSISDRLKTSLMQTIQEDVNLGTQIAQNQLDQLRIIADNTGRLEETNRRLRSIEQNTNRL